MQTFYVIFTDPTFGISVDVWQDHPGRLVLARTYFYVTLASRERLRKLFRKGRGTMCHFPTWSKMRVEQYRVWRLAWDAHWRVSPLLDHLETNGPPTQRMSR